MAQQQVTEKQAASRAAVKPDSGASAERSLGRPPGADSEQVRQSLLAAARQLFLSYEFKAVSVRQIADLAGVNGAMVNYYFGGKKGLYLAMVDEVFNALEKPMQDLSQQDHESVREFVSGYMQFLASNPWWPNFVVREVMFGEEEIRQSIVGKFSNVFARKLIDGVGDEIRAGRYRSDLQPELATWSLMGMMVFPFLSRPVADHLFGQNLNEESVKVLIAHTCELFEHGVTAPEATA
ncbi:MAG: TetR family transcriptional regulator [Gammaproteobacteria bacterium]|nr:TetR family transcriptional regulator [Gammaproteobacteria bacterium]